MPVWMTLLALAVGAWLLASQGVLRRRVSALEGIAPMLRADTEVVAKALSLRGQTLALLVDDKCLACREVYEQFCAMTSPYRMIVVTESPAVAEIIRRIPVSTEPELVGHGRAFRAMDIGIKPALVLLDRRGSMLDSSPVGSSDRLAVLFRELTEA